MKKLTLAAVIAVAASTANAGPWTATVSNGGSAAAINPVAGAIIIGGSLIADELTKPKPFGPNNEITKAVRGLGKALGF